MKEEEKQEYQIMKQTEALIKSTVGEKHWAMFNNYFMARISSMNLRNPELAKVALAAATAILAPDYVPPELVDLTKEALKILQTRLL